MRAGGPPAALQLAAEQAQTDLVQLMQQHAEEWLARLDGEAEQARERARKALHGLESALAEIARSTSVGSWLRGAVSDGRFDRPVGVVVAGSVAPSSARRAANSEALGAGEVLGYAAELIDPPQRALARSLREAASPSH